MQQGIITESGGAHKPLLLFLHGGPGFPIYPFIKAHQVELENDVNVCYWDQRGTGMSYTDEKITLNQLVDDTIKVAQQLLKKFNREKLFIMGHSWGSILGSMVVQKAPQLFYAYIGVGQIGSAKESEREIYHFIKQKATGKDAQKIAKVSFHDEYYKDQSYGSFKFKYTNKFGGGFKRKGYSTLESIIDIFRCPHYSLSEKINIIKGNFRSYQSLAETMAATDLVESVSELSLPVYILQGKHDYMTTHKQAKRFYDQLEAPFKQFYTFEASAHTPFYDEPSRFCQIIKEIVHTESIR